MLWDQAKARAELKESNKYSEIQATGYKIQLKTMEGTKDYKIMSSIINQISGKKEPYNYYITR